VSQFVQRAARIRAQTASDAIDETRAGHFFGRITKSSSATPLHQNFFKFFEKFLACGRKDAVLCATLPVKIRALSWNEEPATY